LMAQTLETAIGEIKDIQHEARTKGVTQSKAGLVPRK
jgi:hypothetical protein